MVSNDTLKRAPVTAISTTGVLFLIFGILANEPRAIGSSLFLILWVLYARYTNSIQASLLTLIAVLPFNITYVIPSLQGDAYVNGIYVNYLAPTLSIIDLFASILLLTLLYTKIITGEFKMLSWLNDLFALFRSRRWGVVTRPGNIYKLALIVLSAYLLFHSIIFWTPVVTIQSLRWVIYIYVAMVFCNEFRNIKDGLSKFLSLMIVSTLIQLVVGGLQVARGTAVGLGWLGESIVAAGNADSSSIVINGNLFLRAYGTFPHPNLFAGFAIIGTIVALTIIFSRGNKLRSRSILLLLISIINVGLSFSHAAYLILILFTLIVVLTLVHDRISKKNSITPIEDVNKISVGRMSKRTNIINPGLLTTSPLYFTDRSISDRLMLLDSTFQYLRQYYLFGVGGGNFTRYFYEFAPVGTSGITLLQPVHNIFMLILVEHGALFGSLLLLMLLGYLIVMGVRTRFSLTYLLVVVSLLLIGNVDHYLLSLPQGFFLFILFIILPYIFRWSLSSVSSKFG